MVSRERISAQMAPNPLTGRCMSVVPRKSVSVVRWVLAHGYPNPAVFDLVDKIVNWPGESAERAG